MNWTLALPELVLSVIGMAILLFGVLRKDENAFLASMFALGGFLIVAFLIVHVTLAEHPGVTTESDGEGLFRRVVIYPKERPATGA